MLRIDADAHVLETEKTWEYMEGAERKFRPQVVGPNDGSSADEYWLVDGTLRLKSRNVGKNTPMASRELRDVNARLKHRRARRRRSSHFSDDFHYSAHAAARNRAGAVPQLQSLDVRDLEPGKRKTALGRGVAAAQHGQSL
ncbi:MAG TPA: hypothetical protein VGW77_34050 [Candidatus Binatia bacterium]|nr:hypothetical protein [Candidatus Binatia bacterium]